MLYGQKNFIIYELNDDDDDDDDDTMKGKNWNRKHFSSRHNKIVNLKKDGRPQFFLYLLTRPTIFSMDHIFFSYVCECGWLLLYIKHVMNKYSNSR